MSHNGLKLFVILFVLTACQAIQPQKAEKKVVLVSIDGLRPEFYLSDRFSAPHLKMMKEQGSYVNKMLSVFPTVTYPNHTTMITGALPQEHGVFSNTRFNNGPTTEWYWDERLIRVKTIWDLLQEKNFETASLNWPVTMYANINYLVPEVYQLKPWFSDPTPILIEKNSTAGLVKKINEFYKTTTFATMEAADKWAANAFEYIYQNHHPKFFAVHFLMLDSIQHEQGPQSPNINKTLAQIDSYIGRMLKTIDPETCLMVVGDHGFIAYDKVINLNRLFLDQGWLQLDKKGKIKSWKVVAHSAGAQAAIYLKDQSLKQKVMRLLRNQQKLGYVLVSKKSLQKYGTYPDAIAAVYGKEGYSVSGGVGKLIEKKSSIHGNHGHAPELAKMKTGFLQYNCSGKKGLLMDEMPNTNIFKLVLKNLDL